MQNQVIIVVALVVVAFLVVVGYVLWPFTCPTELHRLADGSLEMKPSGQTFPDMNAFQQWWHGNRDARKCPLPILTGANREHRVLDDEDQNEQTYAKTPINKVDDYEFSRVFGYEREGRMEVPRQNLNVILNQRRFDWPDKPLSSEERRDKYRGLHEGFTAAGDLKAIVMSEPSAEDLVKEATQRYGEKNKGGEADCRISREEREVADMVAKAYESDPNYEPVVTRVGANHWEVNELKPRRRKGSEGEEEERVNNQVNNRVVDTGNDAVDIQFEYREKGTVESAIDPYFPTGDLPYESAKHSKDPYYGPVPGMERMFGPTFDQKKWY